jgi:hypothetical protein
MPRVGRSPHLVGVDAVPVTRAFQREHGPIEIDAVHAFPPALHLQPSRRDDAELLHDERRLLRGRVLVAHQRSAPSAPSPNDHAKATIRAL